MKNIIIFDNGGKTFDRYTVIIGENAYGMSHNPTSPQGFNQYLGDADEFIKDIGDKIEMPQEIKSAVKDRLLELPF